MANIADFRISRISLRRATTALTALAAFGLWVIAIPSAKAQTLSVLYRFTGQPDGANPFAALIMDKKGNLYGTTRAGGTGTCSFGATSGCGTVFKLHSGKERVLHSFTGSDGANPFAGLIMDTVGNLYGTTGFGGASSNCPRGCGTVFKLDTSGNETVLHSFTGSDGEAPQAGLIMDKAGNLYGTTSGGASSNYGTVFRLDPSGNETVLHSFTGPPGDGATPVGGLIMDTAGNLYGTTQQGGSGTACNSLLGCGTVFKLDTSGSETVVHSFNGSLGDGAFPDASLIIDVTGNLYGTASNGNFGFGDGTVFKVDASGNYTVLYRFCSEAGCADGYYPTAALIMDNMGNLYGTTGGGGTAGIGSVFKLDTSGSETVLHSFTGGDGNDPYAALIMDKKGNLYSTTIGGGFSNCAAGCGTVFKLVP